MVFGKDVPFFLLHLMWLATTYQQCHAYPSQDGSDKEYRLVCVYTASSFYRLGYGKFTVENIDGHLCTHLMYAYAGVHRNKIQSLDGYLDLESDFGKGNFKVFNELREKNPGLSTLLSVGGWDEGSIKFSELAKDPNKRLEFVQSCLDMVVNYGFSGLNVEWLHPAHRGGIPEDKIHFTTLLQDLRDAFDKKGLILSASVASLKHVIDAAYEVDKISKIVDFLNVLSYDYRRGSEKKTGLASPLFAQEECVDTTMNYWLEKGASADKLVVGVSCYGQSWTLASAPTGNVSSPPSPGVEASGPGETWPYTREAGIIAYNEFCESQKEMNWTISNQQAERASFASRGDQWISYDDPESITEKAKYVVKHSLGGLLLHGIESDDSNGLCSLGKFPLLSAAYNQLPRGSGQVTNPTPSSTTTTTTIKPPDYFECPNVGFFVDPLDCNRYFQCLKSGVLVFRCGDKTGFDQRLKVCNWKQLVPECN